MTKILSVLILFNFFFLTRVLASIKMAITIDDLPAHETLPDGMSRSLIAEKMLSSLKKHKISDAYGFINGDQLKWGHENVLKLWIQGGQPMANHTFSHLDLNKVSLDEYKKDILLNEPVLQKFNQTTKIFRYPYLHEGDSVEKRNGIREFLKTNGYKIAQVTMYWEDYAWNSPYARCLKKKDQKSLKWLKESFLKSADETLKYRTKEAQELFKRPIAHILLYHIGAFDAEILEDLIKSFKAKGVEFITLEEAMRDEAYSQDSQFISLEGRDFIQQMFHSQNKQARKIGIPLEKLAQLCL